MTQDARYGPDAAFTDAIAEQNAAYDGDAAEAHGERWFAIDTANSHLGPHGVILSIATATAVVAALRRNPVADDNGLLTPEVLARMIEREIDAAADRA